MENIWHSAIEMFYTAEGDKGKLTSEGSLLLLPARAPSIRFGG
jgi:hypothetical protein